MNHSSLDYLTVNNFPAQVDEQATRLISTNVNSAPTEVMVAQPKPPAPRTLDALDTLDV